MTVYIIKRLLSSIATLWLIITITFILLHCLPGDPFSSRKAVSPKIKKQLEKKYGLDKPLTEQYFVYLNNLLHGDLGISMRARGRKVSDIIMHHFPYSLMLGLKALLLGLFVGVFMGIIAAVFRGEKWDTLSLLIAIIGVSVPSFIIAGILQYVVTKAGVYCGTQILPIAGFSNSGASVLPTIALGMAPVAMIMRIMRNSMIEVLGQDYIKTAKAKGASGIQIIFKHCIRNAIIPVVSYIGPLIAAILTGSFVIEKIFAIPGLGRYFVQSILNNDYTVVLGLVVFYSIFLILTILLVDISYGFIDPRIKVHSDRLTE